MTHNRESIVGQLAAASLLLVSSLGMFALVFASKWQEEGKPSLEVNLDKVAMLERVCLFLAVVIVASAVWLWHAWGHLDAIKKSARARATIKSVDSIEQRRAQTPAEPVVQLVRIGRLPPRRPSQV